MKVTLSHVHHRNCLPKVKPGLLLITVAYNNPFVIYHQLRLLPKYLLDDFYHIVVDNSSKKNVRKDIEKVCDKLNVGYVSLPYNFYSRNSKSHGLALNWAYKHIVRTVKPVYVGFLDHDIYPIRSHRLIPILEEQNFFGQREVKENIWYLWAGFCFFSADFLEGKDIDFKPGIIENIEVDTGGLLFASCLNKINSRDFLFPSARYLGIREGNIIVSDMIEYISVDNQECWLHSINAGYWKDVEPKEAILDKILLQY